MPEEVPQIHDTGMPENDGALERMHSRLYAPAAPASLTPPPLSTELPHATQVAWEPLPPPKVKVKKHFSWTVIFLGISVLFFVVAVGASFFFLIRGGLSVSSNNIIITNNHHQLFSF